MKLKTLKDICEDDFYHNICKERIKKEAIKWVKELRKERSILAHEFAFSEDWIKHFFNISEEDLK